MDSERITDWLYKKPVNKEQHNEKEGAYGFLVC